MSIKGWAVAGAVVGFLAVIGHYDSQPAAAVMHGMGEGSAAIMQHVRLDGDGGQDKVTITGRQLARPIPQPSAGSGSSHIAGHLLRGYLAWRLVRLGFRHLVLGRGFHVLPWWLRG
jgi:hypothetical protein